MITAILAWVALALAAAAMIVTTAALLQGRAHRGRRGGTS